MTGKKKQKSDDARAGGLDESIARLESLVAELEAGDLPLETALEKFEEAVALGATCRAFLERAQARVTKVLEADGADAEAEEPFDVGN